MEVLRRGLSRCLKCGSLQMLFVDVDDMNVWAICRSPTCTWAELVCDLMVQPH